MAPLKLNVQIDFSSANAAVAYAILEKNYDLSLFSVTTVKMYIKIVIGPTSLFLYFNVSLAATDAVCH